MNHEAELTKAYRRIRILELKLALERANGTLFSAHSNRLSLIPEMGQVGSLFHYLEWIEKELAAMKLTKEEEAL